MSFCRAACQRRQPTSCNIVVLVLVDVVVISLATAATCGTSADYSVVVLIISSSSNRLIVVVEIYCRLSVVFSSDTSSRLRVSEYFACFCSSHQSWCLCWSLQHFWCPGKCTVVLISSSSCCCCCCCCLVISLATALIVRQLLHLPLVAIAALQLAAPLQATVPPVLATTRHPVLAQHPPVPALSGIQLLHRWVRTATTTGSSINSSSSRWPTTRPEQLVPRRLRATDRRLTASRLRVVGQLVQLSSSRTLPTCR